jgi:hypothetical protein
MDMLHLIRVLGLLSFPFTFNGCGTLDDCKAKLNLKERHSYMYAAIRAAYTFSSSTFASEIAKL